MWRIALIVFCLLAGSAYSEPPSPAPLESKKHEQAKTRQSQQQTNTEERGSQTRPLGFEILPPNGSDETARHQRENENNKSFYDRLSAWSTLALAVITLFLWYATYKLANEAKKTSTQQATDMKTSLSVAQQSAEAAQMSAYAVTEAVKAALAIQRPYIFVVDVAPDDPRIPEGLDTYISYGMVNYGGVPAIVEHLYVDFMEIMSAEPENHPIEVDHTHAVAKDPIILPQGKRELRHYYVEGSPTNNEWVFQVKVEYRGIFTHSHVTVSTWRVDQSSESFVLFNSPFGGEKYNCTK